MEGVENAFASGISVLYGLLQRFSARAADAVSGGGGGSSFSYAYSHTGLFTLLPAWLQLRSAGERHSEPHAQAPAQQQYYLPPPTPNTTRAVASTVAKIIFCASVLYVAAIVLFELLRSVCRRATRGGWGTLSNEKTNGSNSPTLSNEMQPKQKQQHTGRHERIELSARTQNFKQHVGDMMAANTIHSAAGNRFTASIPAPTERGILPHCSKGAVDSCKGTPTTTSSRISSSNALELQQHMSLKRTCTGKTDGLNQNVKSTALASYCSSVDSSIVTGLSHTGINTKPFASMKENEEVILTYDHVTNRPQKWFLLTTAISILLRSFIGCIAFAALLLLWVDDALLFTHVLRPASTYQPMSAAIFCVTAVASALQLLKGFVYGVRALWIPLCRSSSSTSSFSSSTTTTTTTTTTTPSTTSTITTTSTTTPITRIEEYKDKMISLGHAGSSSFCNNTCPTTTTSTTTSTNSRTNSSIPTTTTTTITTTTAAGAGAGAATKTKTSSITTPPPPPSTTIATTTTNTSTTCTGTTTYGMHKKVTSEETLSPTTSAPTISTTTVPTMTTTTTTSRSNSSRNPSSNTTTITPTTTATASAAALRMMTTLPPPAHPHPPPRPPAAPPLTPTTGTSSSKSTGRTHNGTPKKKVMGSMMAFRPSKTSSASCLTQLHLVYNPLFFTICLLKNVPFVHGLIIIYLVGLVVKHLLHALTEGIQLYYYYLYYYYYHYSYNSCHYNYNNRSVFSSSSAQGVKSHHPSLIEPPKDQHTALNKTKAKEEGREEEDEKEEEQEKQEQLAPQKYETFNFPHQQHHHDEKQMTHHYHHQDHREKAEEEEREAQEGGGAIPKMCMKLERWRGFLQPVAAILLTTTALYHPLLLQLPGSGRAIVFAKACIVMEVAYAFFACISLVKNHFKQLRPPMFTFLMFSHVFACTGILLLFTHPRRWRLFLEVYGFYVMTGAGITCGAHRLWAHRSYKAALPYRLFLLMLNSIANQGSIYHWARDHRVHHKHSDTSADPYNASRGFFYSHMGWLLLKKPEDVRNAGRDIDCSDLLKDPCVRLQKTLDPWWNQCFCFLFPALYGLYVYDSFWLGFFAHGALRWCITLHATWTVNSVAHFWGDRPYNGTIRPRESIFTSFAAIGEGWHNWHHVYPFDYAAAEGGFFEHYNPSKVLIDVAAKMGLVWDRRRATGAWQRVLQKREELKKQEQRQWLLQQQQTQQKNKQQKQHGERQQEPQQQQPQQQEAKETEKEEGEEKQDAYTTTTTTSSSSSFSASLSLQQLSEQQQLRLIDCMRNAIPPSAFRIHTLRNIASLLGDLLLFIGVYWLMIRVDYGLLQLPSTDTAFSTLSPAAATRAAAAAGGGGESSSSASLTAAATDTTRATAAIGSTPILGIIPTTRTAVSGGAGGGGGSIGAAAAGGGDGGSGIAAAAATAAARGGGVLGSAEAFAVHAAGYPSPFFQGLETLCWLLLRFFFACVSGSLAFNLFLHAVRASQGRLCMNATVNGILAFLLHALLLVPYKQRRLDRRCEAPATRTALYTSWFRLLLLAGGSCSQKSFFCCLSLACCYGYIATSVGYWKAVLVLVVLPYIVYNYCIGYAYGSLQSEAPHDSLNESDNFKHPSPGALLWLLSAREQEKQQREKQQQQQKKKNKFISLLSFPHRSIIDALRSRHLVEALTFEVSPQGLEEAAEIVRELVDCLSATPAPAAAAPQRRRGGAPAAATRSPLSSSSSTAAGAADGLSVVEVFLTAAARRMACRGARNQQKHLEEEQKEETQKKRKKDKKEDKGGQAEEEKEEEEIENEEDKEKKEEEREQVETRTTSATITSTGTSTSATSTRTTTTTADTTPVTTNTTNRSSISDRSHADTNTSTRIGSGNSTSGSSSSIMTAATVAAALNNSDFAVNTINEKLLQYAVHEALIHEKRPRGVVTEELLETEATTPTTPRSRKVAAAAVKVLGS